MPILIWDTAHTPRDGRPSAVELANDPREHTGCVPREWVATACATTPPASEDRSPSSCISRRRYRNRSALIFEMPAPSVGDRNKTLMSANGAHRARGWGYTLELVHVGDTVTYLALRPFARIGGWLEGSTGGEVAVVARQWVKLVGVGEEEVQRREALASREVEMGAASGHRPQGLSRVAARGRASGRARRLVER